MILMIRIIVILLWWLLKYIISLYSLHCIYTLSLNVIQCITQYIISYHIIWYYAIYYVTLNYIK
jgi:hypothetical protein